MDLKSISFKFRTIFSGKIKNDECLEICKHNPENIKHVPSRILTEDFIKEVLRCNPYAIEYVKPQTEELCLFAIGIDPFCIGFIKNQTEEMCIIALLINGSTFHNIHESSRTFNVCKVAAEVYPFSVCYIKNKKIREDVMNYHHFLSIKASKELDEIMLRNLPVAPSEIPRDITDSISLEEPKKNVIYGFIKENNTWYLAGSFKDLKHMVYENFRESTFTHIFIPYKNHLYPTSKIHWFRW